MAGWDNFQGASYQDGAQQDGWRPTEELHAISTPEQVELEFGIAGLGSRFVAVLLDQLIIGAVYFVLFFVVALLLPAFGEHLNTVGKWFIAALILFVFLLTWGYFALFEALWHGQTPGKRAMQLRVIQDSGRQITLFEALARNLLRVVDYLPAFYLTGVIAMVCNRRHKRLGDMAAGTLVVHERRQEQPLILQSGATSSTPLGALPGTPAAFTAWGQAVPQLYPADAIARLNGQDLLLIETFFARMLDLPTETRAAMAYRVLAQMQAKMQATTSEPNPERALESIAVHMRGLGRVV